MMDQNTSILIIGGGTFGLSTAYRLAKAGYRHVTVLEKSASIPPEDSAGNDLNKIIRAEYEDGFYTELALQAIQEWKTSPLFAPHYHQTGYLLTNSSNAPEPAKRTLQKSLASISSHASFKDQIQPINTRDDIRAIAPAFDGPMNWTGYFNRLAGYAHAADALRAVAAACRDLGVSLQLGDGGAASLLFDGDTCVGARTPSGAEHRADRVVLALGASAASLVPQIGAQMVAKAWSVGHVRLDPAEAASLAGIPVTYARDLGFFFEPDAATGLLKLCPAGAGFTNFVGDGISLPPADPDGSEEGWIPPEEEDKIRALLRETLPALADRPLVNKKLCWCADTADTEYVIDYVPGKKNLVVAGGDSGHAFKMLPVVGDWVRDVLEKGEQDVVRWRWKEGRRGAGEVSWRVGMPVDLKEFGSRH